MPSTILDDKGKEKEIDLFEILPINEAVVEQYYGKIRSGKTYTGTRDAVNELEHGNVVYTSWRLNWKGLDERKSAWQKFLGRYGFKRRYRYYPIENWHYLPLPGVEKSLEYYYPFTNFYDKLFSLTDCTIFLDEGQGPLNSYERTNISQDKQNGILFTGHYNRTIKIISQRPVQIHPILRANVARFWKIEKREGWLGGIHFTKKEYQDTDSNSLPDESKEPESIEEYKGEHRIYEMYNSKYMRGDAPDSQKNMAKIFVLTKEEIKKL